MPAEIVLGGEQPEMDLAHAASDQIVRARFADTQHDIGFAPHQVERRRLYDEFDFDFGVTFANFRQFGRQPVGRKALRGGNPHPAVEPLVLAGDAPFDGERPLLDDLRQFEDAFAG